jgi:hypothetical protein
VDRFDTLRDADDREAADQANPPLRPRWGSVWGGRFLFSHDGLQSYKAIGYPDGGITRTIRRAFSTDGSNYLRIRLPRFYDDLSGISTVRRLLYLSARGSKHGDDKSDQTDGASALKTLLATAR